MISDMDFWSGDPCYRSSISPTEIRNSRGPPANMPELFTSRIAQKHRDLAIQLGADHYLGKPYDEEQLIALIQENVAKTMPA